MAARVDTGLPLMLAGLALVAATVLLPAHERLEAARFERDKLRAIDAQGRERVRRLARYLAELERGRPELLRSLAYDQMGLAPPGRSPMPQVRRAGHTPGVIGVFDALEPKPIRLTAPRPTPSLLASWTRDARLRPWLLGLGALMALVGVLPQATGRGRARVGGR